MHENTNFQEIGFLIIFQHNFLDERQGLPIHTPLDLIDDLS
jgi:hypothetical protein